MAQDSYFYGIVRNVRRKELITNQFYYTCNFGDPVLERFWDKVIVDLKTGCWNWQSNLTKGGYGLFRISSKKYGLAHRFAYEVNKGKIPQGLHIDHLCRNRSCVNPEHMEAVTKRTNTLRGFGPSAINYKKTYCINGHELKEHNLTDYGIRIGKRVCKQCSSESSTRFSRIRRAKLKQEKRMSAE